MSENITYCNHSNDLFRLENWEKELSEQIGSGDILLCQLPLNGDSYNQDDLKDIGSLLARYIGDDIPNHYLRVQRKFPLSFALFLTLLGIYEYKHGDYWTGVGKYLKIGSYNDCNHLGRLFEAILATKNLAKFPQILQEGGQRHVSQILAHCGIPNDSLADFFQLLDKSIRQSLIQLDAKTLIEEWRANSERILCFLSTPARRFLTYGGEVAEDFVDRCLELLSAPDDEIDDLQLPKRVIDAYFVWRKGVSRESPSKIRLARPVLYVDPYGDGLCIQLPTQQFPLSDRGTQVCWFIKTENKIQQVPTKRQRTPQGYEYVVENKIRVPFVQHYTVQITFTDNQSYTWQLSGYKSLPLLCFDPNTWEQQDEQNQCRSGCKWLLHPKEFTLHISYGQKHRTFFDAQFILEEWDIPIGSQVSLCTPSGKFDRVFSTTEEISGRRPFLSGGIQPLLSLIPERFPLFSGALPNLVIPIADQNQLNRWQVVIKSEGDAYPGGRRVYLLSELIDVLTIKQNGVSIDLSSEKLFGSQAIGKFEIHVRGPLGRGQRLGLQIVPDLHISNVNKIYFTNEPSFFVLTCPEHLKIKLLSKSDKIIFYPSSSSSNEYKIEAGSETQTIECVIDQADGIQVPFTIHPKRFLWQLVQEGAETEAWQTMPIRCYPSALEFPASTRIEILCPLTGINEKLWIGWRLIDSVGKILDYLEPTHQPFKQHFSIAIGELLSSFREANGDTLRVQLWVQVGSSEEHQLQTVEHFVDIAYLFPQLDLGQIITDWKDLKNQIQIDLLWEQKEAVCYRKLLLWPMDQPWIKQPLIKDIPNDAVDFTSLKFLVDQLPGEEDYGGLYLAQIAIVNPWQTLLPRRPQLDEQQVFCISPKHSRKYYQDLKGCIFLDEKASFIQKLTWLTYVKRIQRHFNMHETNRLLGIDVASNVLSLSHMVLWAELLKNDTESSAYQLAQFRIFSVSVLERKLKECRDSELIERYFSHLPIGKESESYQSTYCALLQMGFSSIRQKCIESLCKYAVPRGITELLVELETGRLTFSQAVTLLKPSAEKAIEYLCSYNSSDAHHLCAYLIHQMNWQIHTEVGIATPLMLTETLTRSPSHTLLDVTLHALPSERLNARLDLYQKTLLFSASTLFQCKYCNNVFTSWDMGAKHCCREHRSAPIALANLEKSAILLTKLHFKSL